MTKSEFDCIVVGAGISGTAMAFALARDGRSVLLLERDLSEPDRIVGELLQPGGVCALKQLGLVDCLKGIDAVSNNGYAVLNGTEKTVRLTYPVDTLTEERAWGCSFHHGRFIMRLRDACARQKNIKIVEATVNNLLTSSLDDDKVIGVRCSVKSADTAEPVKQEFHAPLTFVADGCFSKFRRAINHNDVLVRSHFVGAILHDCPLPFPNHGHVVLAEPSPILLYQIGTHDTRVLVDIPGKVPSASSGALQEYMMSHVMPQLPTALQPCFKDAIDNQRLRLMPNSYLTSVPNERKGLIVLGDALNMRHPLTGGGMTVAFNDCLLLSRLLQKANIESFEYVDAVMKILKQFNVERKSHSTAINVLAQALYELFSAGPDWKMKILRDACFDYFRLGGICADHPMGLLSGMRKSPLNLYLHFFAVAFFGMFRLCTLPEYCIPLVLPNYKASQEPVYRSFLYLFVFLLFPVNLVLGFVVVFSAAKIIAPLILNEVRA